DEISIFGDTYVVAGVSQDAEYSHTGVIWMTIDDWRATVAEQTAGEPPFATALLVQGSPQADALDARAGTVSSSKLMSLMAIDVFKSEIGSLALMLGLLLGISALVVGAFFTVWTIQRSKDVAALKAAVPFVISPLTSVLPGAAMVGTGLLGASFAVRSVVRTDPLIALNAQNA